MSGAAADEPAPSAADHAAAARVKARLLGELRGDSRLRGVGLSRDAVSGGFCVEVRVADPAHVGELALAASVEGVPVRVRAVGDVLAGPADPPARGPGAAADPGAA